MIYKIEDTAGAARLFDGWQETLIWSCLQGTVGTVYGDQRKQPDAAMAVCCDFCFFAGSPKEELVQYRPDGYQKNFLIMVPQDEGWAQLIQDCYPKKAKQIVRYATKKEPDIFDRKKLEQAAALLPVGCTLSMMDERAFEQCRNEEWSQDLTGQYADFREFNRGGLGVVLFEDGRLAAGASSYAHYRGGIEIEIDTREDCRRRGMASICGARLILECLERGLYPSWDAHNQGSLALAEKLGYHFSHSYSAYEICGD